MGVYIKGFDFPKACWFCDFCRAYNDPNHGYFCCALNADLDKTTEIIQTQRDKHCPLVEVKPHGRLIDADALSDAIELIDWYHQNKNKDMVEGANSDEEQAWYREQDIYAAIEDAPTIIEAEPDCATCPVKGKACKVFYRDKGDLSVCRELRKVESEE